MPTYTYECMVCNEIFDEFHSMSETLSSCTKCNSLKIKKIIPKQSPMTIKTNSSKNKVGSIVNEYIKNATEDLKAQKKNLKTKNYKVK
jgi:putative FmdB family regulatory protein